ncbi:glycerol-3-phosphate dehydrogenase/oxidase [Chthonobacter albigriseus]|uniref:glycerol-3-phosphate dehydrogenase/oxidase n=1 Tax=Chthonobacter albigriseus TaxID=1683161 RepID=UPI0019D5C636|nr:glycerol-3-phosphate dehydrogenase/oxidase [Chthonobacter albigriseus]
MAPEVLIIGGGINGAGVYMDLAAQGVATLLVERGDFASGTSAAPSRLIHGGLRYLETGEVALVRESVEERNLLLLNAPHVVRPIPCWVPLKSWFGGTAGAVFRFLRLTRTPGRKGAVPVKLGLMFYDLFGNQHRTMPRHRLLAKRSAIADVPGLSPSIRAVAEYFDARITHPERLTLEIIADAEANCPASMAASYLAVIGADGDSVLLEDRLAGERFTVRPKVVVNTSGAWLDHVQKALGQDERLVGGTKGSHLVLRNAELAGQLGERMLYFETADHRACLIYRLGDDRLLLGTTDLRTDDPDDMICSDAEIDYLFDVLLSVMPGAKVSREQIIFSFAGVRPLPRMQAAVAGAISRDHSIRVYQPNSTRRFPILALVGGKWTTYRSCAEQIANEVLKILELPRLRSTKHVAVGGGAGFPQDEASQAGWVADAARTTGCDVERMRELAGRYGSRARAVAALERDHTASPSFAVPGYSEAELLWLAREERVAKLQDIVLRRTLMAFEGITGPAALAQIAVVVGTELGWTAERQRAEVDECLRLLQERHRVTTTRPRADNPNPSADTTKTASTS